MPSAKKIINENTMHLENAFWKKEPLMNGLIVLHTIKSEKIADKIVKGLHDKKFSLQEIQKNQQLELKNKYPITSTETQEVQVDKIRVTEGSIISLKDSSGKSQTIAINEAEPEIIEQIREPVAYTAPEKVDSSDFKRIEHERFIFKSEVARVKNSFFFRAKDGENLFKLGDTFYKDFKAGYKYFGFCHLGAPEAQKKSVLGVASFLHYFENLKILIITSSMDQSFYSQFKTAEQKVEASISVYPEFVYNTYKHEGLNYLEINEIVEKSKAHEIKGLEYLLKSILGDYDIVLFDLPTVNETKGQYSVYFPLFQMIQNVTFTLGLKKNTFTEVEDLKNYFLNYKIKIKGCVLENEPTDKAAS